MVLLCFLRPWTKKMGLWTNNQRGSRGFTRVELQYAGICRWYRSCRACRNRLPNRMQQVCVPKDPKMDCSCSLKIASTPAARHGNSFSSRFLMMRVTNQYHKSLKHWLATATHHNQILAATVGWCSPMSVTYPCIARQKDSNRDSCQLRVHLRYPLKDLAPQLTLRRKKTRMAIGNPLV